MRVVDIGSAKICYLDYNILHVTTEIGKTKSQYTRNSKANIANKFIFSISGSTVNYIKRN